jgi:hypothetical protein
MKKTNDTNHSSHGWHTMRYGKLLLCILPLLALSACDDDGATAPQARGPTAPLRFVNAITDVGAVNFRFIDRVENLPTFQTVQPRAASGLYQGVGAGTRPVKVFPDTLDIAPAMQVIVDEQVNLTANTRYTYVLTGSNSAGTARIAKIEDPFTLPDPGAGNIAVKALHAAAGVGAVDVYLVPVASTTAATPADFATTASAVIRNVAFETQSAYATLPARPTTGTPLYRVVVTNAGSTTPLFAVTPNQPGAAAPATGATGPLPGVQISGSVLTVVVFGGLQPGTRGATTANQQPTALFLIDKPLNP